MKKLLKRITSVFLALILATAVFPACSFAEGNDEHPAGALKILAVVEGVDTGFENDMFFWELAPALNDQTTFYESSHWFFGVGQMCVMAVPYNDTATVNMYATTSRNNNFSEYYEEISGKVKVDRSPKTYVDGNSYPIFVYWPMTNIYTCAIRIEVIDGDVTRNYDLVCKGVDSTDPVAELKAGFNITLEQTPASSFTTSVRGIVEIARTKYAALMEKATTVEEACKIANEFNILVCQAKAIEDEIADLKDAVTEAEDALSELDDAAKTNADAAVTAAKELDLTKYSEEDAAAITEALAALEAELASEEATTASINEATEALNSAVNTAKENALQKAKEDAESALETANGQLEQAKNDLNAANGQITDLNTQLEGTKTELETAKTDLQDATTDLENTKKELEAAKDEVKKIDKVKAVSAKAGKKKVTVKWNKVEGAAGYVVYRSLKKGSGYTEVKTIKKAATVKFVDKKVQKGKKYFYKIRAYKTVSGNQMFGAYSKVLKTKKVK